MNFGLAFVAAASAFALASAAAAQPARRRRGRPRPASRRRGARIPSCGWRTSTAPARWTGSRPRTPARSGVLEGDPRYAGLHARRAEDRQGQGPHPHARVPERARSTTSGRTRPRARASGGARRSTSYAQGRARPGRRCSTSTPSPRRRTPTGSGRAPTALRRTSAAAWSACPTAARTRSTVREFDLDAGRSSTAASSCPRQAETSTGWTTTRSGRARLGAGQMTASGYPFVVKRLKRGQPLRAAVEVFRGTASDDGRRLARRAARRRGPQGAH